MIAWLLSLPFAYTLAKSDGGVLVWHDWLGVGLFAIGFIFEAVGDAHLYFFKRNPENKGKVLDRGLWSLTRHPNYFGEAVLWWGFFAIAIPAAPLWTVFSPIVMTYLLVRVSGVKMLDELLARTKPGYREYMERTSGFVPWPKGGSNMKAKRIRKWLLGLGVLAAAGSMGCSSHQPLISADYVDLDQFMGDWYVIANIPTPPEKNAVNALEQYARKPNGDIDITFSFNKGDVTAKRKVMHAKGFVQEEVATLAGRSSSSGRFAFPIT